MMGESENASVKELGLKKVKLPEMDDRISDLPDFIIHHILSFLPSIKDAIQTCVLSKRWKNQWTCVPVLTFNLLGMSEEYASQFVFSTLTRYDCPKIKKFRIVKDCDYVEEYPDIVEGISFAVRKNAEEIVLDLFQCEFLLPECIFNHSALVNLNLSNCKVEPNGKVCWGNLKEFSIGCCFLSDQAVHNILCGSPVLESLVFETCFECDHLVIDSKSLKKLELGFELSVLEISCPNLEQLNLVNSFSAQSVKFMDLPSLNHATIDSEENIDESAYMEIFQYLQHIKDLKLGTCFLEFLSDLEDSVAQSLPLWNNKCLTLRHPDFNEHTSGIALALYYSHLLEKLVITRFFPRGAEFPDSEEENY